ncbi:aminopeptidase [Alcanivorax sp. S6407]|uniref:aminopeptidase n=1 Tax=Alcanivorax sp. S6407 TaxID=2926424 RepID=UPI001FF381F8|nr:aminopeptidase [Alcanivorax sp. S6407]MCK0155125.1 aminopeptidase [Alcanivorax sp. S6407]
MRRLAVVFLLALAVLLAGCQLGYYGQAVSGHFALMGKREPVDAVLADPQTPAPVAAQLAFSQQVIAWAGPNLDLPAEDVYHQYVALDQDAVVWNVLAAPKWSLSPKTWCYPMLGCVSYRGYFDQQRAEQEAASLASDGMDTWVGGAIAYSTLGWFADPLTTPMLKRSQPALAELLIHELTHRRIYIANDTRFNESLATLVGREGALAFLADSGIAVDPEALARRDRAEQAFLAIIEDTRSDLKALYERGGAEDALAAGKAQIQQQARERFVSEQTSNPALAGYQGFFDGPLNNAQLNGVSDYNGYVPAFARLLDQCQRDWGCFWQQVGNLADLTDEQRRDALTGLSGK